jgi:hypothetical protein
VRIAFGLRDVHPPLRLCHRLIDGRAPRTASAYIRPALQQHQCPIPSAIEKEEQQRRFAIRISSFHVGAVIQQGLQAGHAMPRVEDGRIALARSVRIGPVIDKKLESLGLHRIV